MKRHYMLTLILGAGALGVATFADQAHADKGITINEQSSTKTLSSVGKSNSDTTVYTDTMGLTPQPEFKQIQDNPNFIVSEKSFPKPQPAMSRNRYRCAQVKCRRLTLRSAKHVKNSAFSIKAKTVFWTRMNFSCSNSRLTLRRFSSA